jgi:hypothetical protein
MYLNENNSTFPRLGHPLKVAPRGKWLVSLNSFRGQKIKTCPSAVKEKPDGQQVGSVDSVWNWGGASNDWTYDSTIIDEGSYGFNCWLYNAASNWDDQQFYWKKVTKIRSSGNVPLFTDSVWVGAWPRHDNTPAAGVDDFVAWNEPQHMRQFCIDRHSGYVNSAMVDLSVQKVGLKELWKLKWHREFDASADVNVGNWPEWMAKYKDF